MIAGRTGELGVIHVAGGMNKDSPNFLVVREVCDLADPIPVLAESDDRGIGIAGVNEANLCRDAHGVCSPLRTKSAARITRRRNREFPSWPGRGAARFPGR